MTVEVVLAMLDSTRMPRESLLASWSTRAGKQRSFVFTYKNCGAMLASLKFLGNLRGGFSLSSSNNDSPLEET